MKENPDKLANEIKSSMAEHLLEGQIQVFVHHTLTKDISIHLHQETVGDRKPKMELGLELAAGLSEYGLINHNVWMEFESEKSEGNDG